MAPIIKGSPNVPASMPQLANAAAAANSRLKKLLGGDLSFTHGDFNVGEAMKTLGSVAEAKRRELRLDHGAVAVDLGVLTKLNAGGTGIRFVVAPGSRTDGLPIGLGKLWKPHSAGELDGKFVVDASLQRETINHDEVVSLLEAAANRTQHSFVIHGRLVHPEDGGATVAPDTFAVSTAAVHAAHGQSNNVFDAPSRARGELLRMAPTTGQYVFIPDGTNTLQGLGLRGLALGDNDWLYGVDSMTAGKPQLRPVTDAELLKVGYTPAMFESALAHAHRGSWWDGPDVVVTGSHTKASKLTELGQLVAWPPAEFQKLGGLVATQPNAKYAVLHEQPNAADPAVRDQLVVNDVGQMGLRYVYPQQTPSTMMLTASSLDLSLVRHDLGFDAHSLIAVAQRLSSGAVSRVSLVP